MTTHDAQESGHFGQDYVRNALALKAIGGGVWDYDIESGALYCNHRWHELLGLDPRLNPITSISTFSAYVHPDDVEMATRVDLAELTRLVAEHERYIAEFRIVRPDGEIRRIRSVACLVEAEGRPTRAVGCITDITDTATHPEAAAMSPPPRSPSATETLLTKHERECLWWVSYGKTAWETAGILGKSPRTVEYHLANAVRKMGAANKIHAVVLAIRRNLI